MPVMDGFQLCRKVKTNEALRRIPFIVYTATYTGPKDQEFAIKIGADRFIPKPCEPDAFFGGGSRGDGRGKPRRCRPVSAPAGEEEILRLYSERLVRKLEQKMMELEKEIQARRETEEALAKRERYYRTMLFNLHEDIMVIDRDYRITDINNTALQTLGRKPEEAIGRHCYELSFGLDAPCSEYGRRCLLPRVFETGRPCNWQLENAKSDNGSQHIDIRMSPMKRRSGKRHPCGQGGKGLHGPVSHTGGPGDKRADVPYAGRKYPGCNLVHGSGPYLHLCQSGRSQDVGVLAGGMDREPVAGSLR